MKYKLLALFVGLLMVSGCRTYLKEVPTGEPMQVDNIYASPTYDHSKILNLLVLPINNPLEDQEVDLHRDSLRLSVLRNFSKFNYFNVQFDKRFHEMTDELIDLETGIYDRAKVGAIGQEYNAQALMQISIDEFRAYPPMRMKIKAMIVDSESGERVWAFDHVFDTDDANVMNAMRRWWNTRIAGGDVRNRFELSTVRPSIFTSFVFYSMAKSYGRARLDNVASIERQKQRKKKNRQPFD